MAKYSDVYNHLNFETAIITFIKKNGEIRVMLATRDIQTIELWGSNSVSKLRSHERRCNISNNVLPVIDLEIDDARSFNIEYLVDYRSLGVITNIEQLLQALDYFKKYRVTYLEAIKKKEEAEAKTNFFDGFKI